MGRLNEAGIRVYLLHGNHDAESVITRRLGLPSNVKVFAADRPCSFELAELGVALHGQSYPERAVFENLVPGYPEPVPGAFNIGVLHTALAGAQGHEPYAPCALAELVNKGYDYWALGHVHQREILHERPYVVFPGNLQGRHIRKPDRRARRSSPSGTMRSRRSSTSRSMSCAGPWSAWMSTHGATPGDVTDRAGAAIESAVQAEADGRLLLCRVVLEGPTDLHAHLLGAREQLLADARATALGLGEDVAWVEKVVVATEPQRAPPPPSSPTASATCSKAPPATKRIRCRGRNRHCRTRPSSAARGALRARRRRARRCRRRRGCRILIAGLAPELHARLCTN